MSSEFEASARLSRLIVELTWDMMDLVKTHNHKSAVDLGLDCGRFTTLAIWGISRFNFWRPLAIQKCFPPRSNSQCHPPCRNAFLGPSSELLLMFAFRFCACSEGHWCSVTGLSTMPPTGRDMKGKVMKNMDHMSHCFGCGLDF